MDEEFGKYLARRRGYRTRVDVRNPAADEMVELLQKHLKTVASWLNGYMNRSAMVDAMSFFREYFPGQYEATEGRLLYRGQTNATFAGDPRSYSYDGKIADDFACGMFPFGWGAEKTLLIRRKVTRTGKDRAAFRLSLDIAKLMKAYAAHKYAGEKEVVILNTPPRGTTAEVLEVAC